MTEGGESVPGKWATPGNMWFWFSQVTSVIGLISIIDDLRLWASFIAWTTARLRDLLPLLAELFSALVGAVDWLAGIFRTVFRPVVDFCLQWLPFELPDVIKDGLVVAAFVGLGLLRTSLRYGREWQSKDSADTSRMIELCARYGIRCDGLTKRKIRSAIHAYHFRNNAIALASKSYSDWLCRAWEEGRAEYGPELERLAIENPGYGTSQELYGIHLREERARNLILMLGAATGVLVALDVVLVP